MKKLSVSIGIAAYKAENNIGPILDALLTQAPSPDFKINKITVHCDNSGDNTAAVAASYKNPKVKVIKSSFRRGFAGSIKVLLAVCLGSIVVLLNDDIKITDNRFIEKMVIPFETTPKLGLLSGNPIPMPPKNFIESALVSSIRAWDNMSAKIRGGNNIFTLDGKTLALSRNFINQLKLPKNLNSMGNVDVYMYLECIRLGLTYEYARRAEVYFRCPSSFNEYINWSVRNNSNHSLLREKFGELADREYFKPQGLYLRSIFREFLRHPLKASFIFITGFYIRLRAKDYARNFNTKWESIATSKDLQA